MLKRIFFMTILSLLCHTVQVSAQSAVYFCKQTGKYGFCYGGKTAMAARECAYLNCLNAGGTQPTVIVWTEKKGFGAICVGTNATDDTVIGVAIGFDTQDEADEQARRECEKQGAVRMRVRERWEDN